MNYELHNCQPDEAGKLLVTAETVADVVRMQLVMRLFNLQRPDDALAYAAALQGGTLSRYLDTRAMAVPYLKLEGAFRPYADLLEKLTSYRPTNWELDLTPLFGGLHHQYITLKVSLSGMDVVTGGYGMAWDDRRPAVRAEVEANMADYLQEKLGWRRQEPEFIQRPNGCYQRNPDYARIRHKAVPGLGSPELWDLVFDHWRKNHATPGQREVLDKADALTKGFAGHDYALRPALELNEGGVFGYQLTIEDPNGTINWDDKGTMVRMVQWEEFKKL